MTQPLACVDSTVAPQAALQLVAELYGMDSLATCELLQRHLDATYLVSEVAGRHVVRLYNARWWSRQEVEGEVAILRHLQARGILAYDLGVFRWTQRLVGAPEQTWQDFVEGYRTQNEFSDRELASTDLLVVLRQAYLLGHDARRTRIESLGTRWRRVRRTPGMDVLRRLDAEVFGTQAEQGG